MNPWVKGKVTPQAHVDVPEGTCEEEYARGGFFGRYAHLYRSEPPVGWTHIEGPLRPRAYDTNRLRTAPSADYLRARIPILENSDVRISFFGMQSAMFYFFRNADSEELFFIHQGKAILETDFGPLDVEVGDYVCVPRGTVYRWVPQTDLQVLLVESRSEFDFPDKGMLGQHALFDPALLRVPDPAGGMSQIGEQKEYCLKILRQDQVTSVYYPFCPLNTVGWKGTLAVWKLNVRDIRPVSCDRYHLPPSAHTTLVAKGFVVCTFLPRPLENGDDKAMKVPFFHSNIDFDEVLFYHSGEFFSRAGVGAGMITFHPQGIQHGPQPGAVERTKGKERTNEIAVMIDTKNPLHPSAETYKIEWTDYWKSWSKP